MPSALSLTPTPSALSGAFVPGLTTTPALDPSGALAGGDVRAAIARAASATGVDFSYLLAQAKLESSLNPRAAAGTSSARGLYQFTNGTWAQTLAKHGDALDAALGGDGSGAAGIPAGLADPATRSRLMALRNDPEASAMMAAELAGDNQVALTNALGRTPDPAELYLAHFLGADGATTFLAALSTDPNQSAAALLPKAAAANSAIFFDGGVGRSVGSVMMLVRAKMAAAMAETPGGADAVSQPSSLGGPVYVGTDIAAGNGQTLPVGGPLAQEFASAQVQAQGQAQGQAQASSGSSMAETLSTTFGLASSDGAVPDFVRAAYGRMAALGL